MVANALSGKSMGSLAHIAPMKMPLVREIHQLKADGMRLELGETRIFLTHIRAQSFLVKRIKVMQGNDLKLSKLMEEVKGGKHPEFAMDVEGVLHCGNCLCVPNGEGLMEAILEEGHNLKYSVHPGSVKIYQDIKQVF